MTHPQRVTVGGQLASHTASHRTPQNILRHHFRRMSNCARIRLLRLPTPWMHIPVSPRRQPPWQSPQQCRQWRTTVMYQFLRPTEYSHTHFDTRTRQPIRAVTASS